MRVFGDGANDAPRRRGTVGLAAVVLSIALGLGGSSGTAHALTINATFDSSITSSASASAIESAITSALGFYSTFFNPVTVNIDYQLAPTGSTYLGASQSSFYLTSYGTYTGAVQADATLYGNSVAQSGYNNLSSGNTAAQILATSADYRALGFTTPGVLSSTGVSGAGTFDGIVYLNASYLTGFGGSGSYTANGVIQHETDEVLGIGGSGSVLNTMQANGLTSAPSTTGGTYVSPLDLFRYSAPGTASLSTSATTPSYFSVNGGATSIAGFNQCSTGDYGDWASPGNPCGTSVTSAPLVQLAYTGANSPATLSLSAPEVTALQAIGYALPITEPAGLAVFGVALIGLGLGRRPSRRC
ncbi:MAG: NF038122 family metalloprotease [Rhodospirillales bacterium]|nr:NF038122 family metalloprotease [Rhodospirillales bacterium]